jgi:DsbC/DsbD-like thiol-disulfide interchange protein
MYSDFRFDRILPLVLAAGLIGGTNSAAIAADASPWATDIRSAARLIAATARTESGARVTRAGVEIKLQPGWKTYWRYPGDSGVPPVFDFSRSENVKSVTVRYPAPVRFADGGGTSVGYKSDVVLPLQIVPENAAKPVMLRLKLDYAVCEKLCVPAEAKLELLLTGERGAQEAAVDTAEARVPKPVSIGDQGMPAIRSVRHEAGPGKPRIIVDVAAPAGSEVTLLAEGPTLRWALPLPKPIAGAGPGLQRFSFELDGLPPGAKPSGATLRLTAIAGDQAIEAAFRLD